MKAARVLSIIGLIIGLIGIIIPLTFGKTSESKVRSEIKSFEEDFSEGIKHSDDDLVAYKMLKFADFGTNMSKIIGNPAMIIGGVIGFFGHLLKIKSKYFFIILLVCGILSLISLIVISGILYIIAAFLFRKNEQNINKTETT
jgi:hypothetical protein